MARQRSSLPLILGIVVVVLALVAGLFFVLAEPAPAPSADVRPVQPTTAPTAERPALPEPAEVDDRPRVTPEVATDAPAPGALSGRVLDPIGRPLDAVRVELFLGRPESFGSAVALRPTGRHATTDGEGRFLMKGVPSTGDVALRLMRAGFVVRDAGPFAIAPKEPTEVGDLVLDAGVTITGRVTGPRGEVVTDARVSRHEATFVGLTSASDPEPLDVVATDERGSYQMVNVPRGAFHLEVTCAGYGNAIVEVPRMNDAFETTRTFDVQLQKSSELVGFLLDARDDEPIAGAEILATPTAPSQGRSRTTSGRDGSFRFLDLAPGRYKLWSDPVGYTLGSTVVPAEQYSETIALRLEPAGVLTGFVRTPEGEPVRGFDLLVKRGDNRRNAGTPIGGPLRFVNDDAAFEVEDLNDGWYSFEAWSRGYAVTLTGAMRLRKGQRLTGLVITLQPGAVLSGRVVDDAGTPVSGATVSLRTNRQPNIDFLRASDRDAVWLQTTRTAKDGTWLMDGVTQRVYQVEVDHPAYPVAWVDDIEANAGETTDVPPIVVERPGTLTGVAVGSGGQHLAGVIVYLAGPQVSNRTVTTDQDGRYTFGRLVPGTYSVMAKPADATLADMHALAEATMRMVLKTNPEDSVTIGPGQVQELNVRVNR